MLSHPLMAGGEGGVGNPGQTGPFSSLARQCSRQGLALSTMEMTGAWKWPKGWRWEWTCTRQNTSSNSGFFGALTMCQVLSECVYQLI